MLRPLKDWVFTIPEIDKDGLIKEVGDKRPEKGQIVAVGPGRINKKGERVPMTLKIGDRIFWGKKDHLHSMGTVGYGFIHDDVKYYAIKESEVKGLL